MPLPSILSYAVTLAAYSKYLLFFVGMTFGGPLLILASGFFLRLGEVELIPLFCALVLGELTIDIVWYVLGYFYADELIRRFGRFFNFTPELFTRAKELFAKYHSGILFISKLIMGLGMAIPILITAGATRMSFKKYIAVNALGEIIWVSVLLWIGYVFGHVYGFVAEEFRIIFVALTCVGIVLIMHVVSRFGRRKAERDLKD